MQEAVVICLNKQTREAVDETLCVSARRPPQLLQSCNIEPCPPRWEMEVWSFCSATCGVGLQTRAVSCVLRTGSHSNHTEKVKDENCRQPKPSSVQACNRFDCPPTWDVQEWSQCSRSCGGGSQRREIMCKQRMADGSLLELPETFCPTPGLPSVQPCGTPDCPAQWVSTNWTQCSATCGEGTQRLLVVCKVLRERGQYQTTVPEACAAVPKPPTVRSCFLGPCEKLFKPVAVKPQPTILAEKKVYIQWRKGKKLHLAVGSIAYLLPWTSVVLRCPTRHFRKGHIRWLKDGKPLETEPNLSISHVGYVKIQQVRASDAGTYTCVAGQTQENFVLKLIGSKQKMSVPETDLWITDGFKTSPKVHQTSSATEGKQSLNSYDDIVQHLLDLKELPLEGNSKELLDFVEKNSSNLEEDPVLDSLSPQLLVTDMLRLDEIRRNLSGAVHGSRKDELITQLLDELTKSHRENNESTLQPHESPAHSTRDSASQKSKQRQSSHSSRQWRGHLQSPVILQKSSRDHISKPHEIVDYVGGLILVPKQTVKVEIKCQVQGNPEPVISWYKDGKVLGNSSRVGLMPDGSLHIQAPGETDTGHYTCTATNSLGSVSLSSHLQTTGSRCVSSAGEANTSACLNKTKTSVCHGQHCLHRWQVSSWSSCSESCGGGIQSRTVTCQETSGGSVACTGKKPTVTRHCNLQPCVAWATTPWGPCQGHCVGSRQALQYRHVFCQDKNSTRVAHQMCSGQPRPASQRNCTTEACALHWRVGSWTQCTATCGRHGFQSRHVTCVHRRSGKPAREFHCAWKPRPPSWQRCNILSCGRGECRDSTRYCEKVRQLELCPLPQFKSRCCQSCKDT